MVRRKCGMKILQLILFLCGYLLLFAGISACQGANYPASTGNTPATDQPALPAPQVRTRTPSPWPLLEDSSSFEDRFHRSDDLRGDEGEDEDYEPTTYGITLKPVSDEGGLNLVSEAGAKWTRTTILWINVEPQKGERNWNALASREQEWINAAEKQIAPIVVVQHTPPWAHALPGYLCGPILTEELPAFASFMFDLVQRYSAPPYNIRYWEIGNEPDIAPIHVPTNSGWGCWGDPTDPYYGGGVYAEMLKFIYPQIKAADPDAQVLVGGLLLDCDPINPPMNNEQPKDCSSARFFEGILTNGGAQYFDGVSFHAYDYYGGPGVYGNANWHSTWNTTGPVQIAKAAYLRSLLNHPEYNAAEKYLINTEIALLCDACVNDADFEATKAAYVAQGLVTGPLLGLKAVLWYDFLGWRNSGLVSSDLSPLPAYHAYKFMASQLENATLTWIDWSEAAITQSEELVGFQITQDERRTWIVWAPDGQSTLSNFVTFPDVVYDLFGNTLDFGDAIQIGIQPVVIDWLD